MAHSKFRSILWMLLPAFTLADPPQLTYETYDATTENRAILIRFVTSLCEECDATHEAWQQLSQEWEEHPIGLVAQVSCDTLDGEPLCDLFEVAGYPSVYYGDPESPELYKGGLDYESLAGFAKENIAALPCSVRNLAACNDKVQKTVAKLQLKTREELEALEREVLKKVEEEQQRFDKVAMKLQRQYKDLANNFNTKIDRLRESSAFKWIQQLLREMEKVGEQESKEEEEPVDEL